MAVIARGERLGHPVLLRRLMVRCPHTQVPVDTGYEVTAIPTIGRDAQMLIDCIECGQDHTWRIEEAFAES